MSLVFTHFSKVGNVGDLYSCPADYFGQKFLDYSKVNFIDLKSDNDDLIIGGGGMLHHGFIHTLKKLINKKRKIILWGAGINEHDLQTQFFPSFLNQFDLVGIRDWKNPWEYVPCASCMNNVFDTEFASETEFVVYEHYDKNIPINNFPKRSNRLGKNETLIDIIKFLSVGNTIITNSYHGAYWGLLINKKVLIFEPFSNRFYGLEPEVIYCTRYDWQEKSKKTIQIYENYLEKCKKLNVDFSEEVVHLLLK